MSTESCPIPPPLTSVTAGSRQLLFDISSIYEEPSDGGMKMISVTDYLELPAEVRRKTDLLPKPRGKYRSLAVREEWRSDPEALIEYLREHELNSASKVQKNRRAHQADSPTVSDFVRAYGSWKTAKETAFGRPIINHFTPEPTPSANYLISAALTYDLKTRDRWCEARKSNDLVPSIAAVRRQFGSFTKLKLCARMVSPEWGLEAYMSLARRKGRLLTANEMMRNGINLSQILACHGKLADRNWLLRKMMKIADQRETQRREWDFFPRDIASSEQHASN